MNPGQPAPDGSWVTMPKGTVLENGWLVWFNDNWRRVTCHEKVYPDVESFRYRFYPDPKPFGTHYLEYTDLTEWKVKINTYQGEPIRVPITALSNFRKDVEPEQVGDITEIFEEAERVIRLLNELRLTDEPNDEIVDELELYIRRSMAMDIRNSLGASCPRG